ncbi:MAG: hypothetical protein KIT84_16425 [Labilithrix sp.]|nr:hypothetical protein [Labilithrix sp.]MCW5812616.1 hypothetical protein [Labilithrix sp.]
MGPSAYVWCAALLLGVSGCARYALGGADPDALQSASVVEWCPLGVPGTRMHVSDTQDGVAVHFSTRASNVEDLRLRVHDQARVNGADRHRGRGHFGDHQGARNHGLRLWALPPTRANVEDTPTGAALALAPLDPTRRSELRDAVAKRVAEIERAGCL